MNCSAPTHIESRSSELFLRQLGPHVQCNSGQQSIQLAYENFLPLLDVIDISPFQTIGKR